MSRQPIDTSTLGPVRISFNADEVRAESVRKALTTLSLHFDYKGNPRAADAAAALGLYGDAAGLALLGRLLR